MSNYEEIEKIMNGDEIFPADIVNFLREDEDKEDEDKNNIKAFKKYIENYTSNDISERCEHFWYFDTFCLKLIEELENIWHDGIIVKESHLPDFLKQYLDDEKNSWVDIRIRDITYTMNIFHKGVKYFEVNWNPDSTN